MGAMAEGASIKVMVGAMAPEEATAEEVIMVVRTEQVEQAATVVEVGATREEAVGTVVTVVVVAMAVEAVASMIEVADMVVGAVDTVETECLTLAIA